MPSTLKKFKLLNIQIIVSLMFLKLKTLNQKAYFNSKFPVTDLALMKIGNQCTNKTSHTIPSADKLTHAPSLSVDLSSSVYMKKTFELVSVRHFPIVTDSYLLNIM